MKFKKTISLPALEVKEMIKDLSVIVVSLDRIGSAYYDNPRKRAVELSGFLDVDKFKRLARIRGILSEAYDSQSTKADVMRLEEEAENLPYWQSKQK